MDKALDILVVDGSRVARALVGAALRSEIGGAGLHITAVAGAREALALLRRRRYDLVTSALMLPDSHGIELCRAVRALPGYRFTPFIVVTAEPHDRLIRDGYGAGVTDYFDKNLGYRELVSFVHQFARRYAVLRARVLLLEDSVIEARGIIAMMERHGLKVTHVTSARLALEIIDDSYDLVVTDFFLADDISGGDFLHSLRCGLRYAPEELPVLVVTGSDDAGLQAEIFHAGGNDFVRKPLVEEVLISRIRSLLLLKQQFVQLRQQSETLRRMATFDNLTGVYNRGQFLERAPDYCADMLHYPVWVVVIDLDHFKAINDQHGHPVGDRVLAAVGGLLRGFFGPGDLVARMGGEEFVTLLGGYTRAQATATTERLRAALEALHPAGLRVTASIGLAGNLDHAQRRFEELLEEADRAMYSAKRAGRNRVVCCGEVVTAAGAVG